MPGDTSFSSSRRTTPRHCYASCFQTVASELPTRGNAAAPEHELSSRIRSAPINQERISGAKAIRISD